VFKLAYPATIFWTTRDRITPDILQEIFWKCILVHSNCMVDLVQTLVSNYTIRRKYTAYHNAARERPSHVQKLRRSLDVWFLKAGRQTERRTDRQTCRHHHHNTGYSAPFAGRSNCINNQRANFRADLLGKLHCVWCHFYCSVVHVCSLNCSSELMAAMSGKIKILKNYSL